VSTPNQLKTFLYKLVVALVLPAKIGETMLVPSRGGGCVKITQIQYHTANENEEEAATIPYFLLSLDLLVPGIENSFKKSRSPCRQHL
jgi:hypothetical protein